MTSPLLPGNFASQSSAGRLTLSQAVEHRRTIVGLVEADRYPASGRLYLPGLLAARHYSYDGAARGFARTAVDGTLMIEIAVSGPALLVIAPVV